MDGRRVSQPLSHRLGWQPTRFLADRAEAERAFQLAERLGSVNAAAKELDTSWPSLRKAFGRHGLGMPARNPEAVRQRAVAGASRAGPPAAPTLDPVFVILNQGQVPAARGADAEQGVRLRRAEEIETLSDRTVVELNAESRLTPSGGWPPSPADPNAPNGWPTSEPAGPTVANSSAPPAPTVPTDLQRDARRGGWSPMPDRPTLPGPAGDRGTPSAAALGCADGRAERAVDGCLQAVAAGGMAWAGGGRRRWLRELVGARSAARAARRAWPLPAAILQEWLQARPHGSPPTADQAGERRLGQALRGHAATREQRAERCRPRARRRVVAAGASPGNSRQPRPGSSVSPSGVGPSWSTSASSRWTLRDQATRPDGGR